MKIDHTQVRCPNDYDFKFYVDLIFSMFNNPSLDIPVVFTYIGTGASTIESFQFALPFQPRTAFLFSQYNFGIARVVSFFSNEKNTGVGLGTDSAHSPVVIGFSCGDHPGLGWFPNIAYLTVTPSFNQLNVYYVCMIF